MKSQDIKSTPNLSYCIIDAQLNILSKSHSLTSIFGIKSESDFDNLLQLFTILLKNNKQTNLTIENIKEYCLKAFSGASDVIRINYKLKQFKIFLLPILIDNDVISKVQIAFEDISAIHLQFMEMSKLNQELIDANTTKDKFFSIIAHDLKNPLSTFKQVTEILYDEMDNLEISDIKEYIFDLKNSALSSLQLLENLLEWAGIQRGKIKYNPAENYLQMIISNTIALLQIKAEQKNINLFTDVNTDLKVYCDANMVMTIIRNLCTNALKFTPPNGTIRVWASIENKACKVCIQDSGVGIKAEDVDKLFRIDVHHSTIGTSSEEGTGLGLILCKEFAEIHDGKIWVESELGKGSSFFFTIPLA